MELNVLFEGYSLIKYQTNINTKLLWISNYSPAKIFIKDNSYNLYECFDNHPIKITSGFWILTSLNSVSAQLSDVSLGSLRLYKSI